MRIFGIYPLRSLLRSIRIISTVSIGKYRQEENGANETDGVK